MRTKDAETLKSMDERVESAVPMKRMGMPREIAEGLLYLAGGRSSFVTGSALVDGGILPDIVKIWLILSCRRSSPGRTSW